MIRNMKKTLIILIVFISVPALAKDFGTRGHTYNIIEQPFLQMIDERLKKVDMDAERKKMEEALKEQVRNANALLKNALERKEKMDEMQKTIEYLEKKLREKR